MGVSFCGGVVGGASHLSSTLTDEKVHLAKIWGKVVWRGMWRRASARLEGRDKLGMFRNPKKASVLYHFKL